MAQDLLTERLIDLFLQQQEESHLIEDITERWGDYRGDMSFHDWLRQSEPYMAQPDITARDVRDLPSHPRTKVMLLTYDLSLSDSGDIVSKTSGDIFAPIDNVNEHVATISKDGNVNVVMDHEKALEAINGERWFTLLFERFAK